MTRREIQERFGLIGSTKEMEELIDIMRQVADTDITVLITGESGTGKEVFARALHGLSRRTQRPLVTVNCGAIPEGLIESELFGHEKGSFTSAVESRKGFFETAHDGSLFLDEIGELPLGTQAKLLRVLENGEYSKVGSSSVRRSNARIIAATNKDLEYEVSRERFRADLFFRLRSVNIRIPPLRSRREDIPLLVDHYAALFTATNRQTFAGFDDSATSLMMSYHWPGNIRELRNVIENVVLLEHGKIITADILQRYLYDAPRVMQDRGLPVPTGKTVEQTEREMILRALVELNKNIAELKGLMIHKGNGERPLSDSEDDTPLSLEEMELRLIRQALKRHKGNRRLAARELNISERTLYRKLRDRGMEQ